MKSNIFGNLLYTNTDKVNDPQKGLVIVNQNNDYFIAKGAEQNFIHLGLPYPNNVSSKFTFEGYINSPWEKPISCYLHFIFLTNEKYLF